MTRREGDSALLSRIDYELVIATAFGMSTLFRSTRCSGTCSPDNSAKSPTPASSWTPSPY